MPIHDEAKLCYNYSSTCGFIYTPPANPLPDPCPGQTPINPLSRHIFLNLYTQQPQLIIPHNLSTITLLQEL